MNSSRVDGPEVCQPLKRRPITSFFKVAGKHFPVLLSEQSLNNQHDNSHLFFEWSEHHPQDPEVLLYTHVLLDVQEQLVILASFCILV